MPDVGRPSELTDEITFKIRQGVLDGVKYIQIQEELGIHHETWDGWVYRNYKGFRENLNSWKKERILRKAEKNLDILLESEDEKVRADMTKFSLETLGKDEGYSKRNEMTGKDGKDLTLTINQVNYGGGNDSASIPAETLPATAAESFGSGSEESSNHVASEIGQG